MRKCHASIVWAWRYICECHQDPTIPMIRSWFIGEKQLMQTDGRTSWTDTWHHHWMHVISNVLVAQIFHSMINTHVHGASRQIKYAKCTADPQHVTCQQKYQWMYLYHSTHFYSIYINTQMHGESQGDFSSVHINAQIYPKPQGEFIHTYHNFIL